MKFTTEIKCPECLRVFDLMDEDDSDEWHYGHDCVSLPFSCPNGGPDHRPGAVGRKTCGACDY